MQLLLITILLLGFSSSSWAQRVGHRRTAATEFGLEVARGNVTGTTFIHKFGEVENIDDGIGFIDIWDGGSVNDALRTYEFSSGADINRLSSSDDTDTQDIEIQGLDVDHNLVTQTITLTGQTPVALTTSLIRVFRMKNVGTVDNAGDIYCFENITTTLGVPDTITNTRAIIQVGNNQTLMAIYTIPNGKTGYMCAFYLSLAGRKDQNSDMHLLFRASGSVFQLKHSSSILSTGTSHLQHRYDIPETGLEAKTDIIMKADSSKADGVVSGGFDLILIDDE